MPRVIKRLFILLCTVTAMLALAPQAYANDYARKVQEFLNNSAWCDGTPWREGQQPKTPGRKDFAGCAAYACDFARFVWGVPNSYKDGQAFYSYLDISDGDVISTGNHYYVVLHREGNELWTAEGNANKTDEYTDDGVVWVTTSHYSMTNTHFSMGWHNPVIQPYDPTAYLNVDGLLDGKYSGTLTGFGSCDVYIKRPQDAAEIKVADDVDDYYDPHLPFGTAFRITDIRAADGYAYTGTDVISNIGVVNTDVQLQFVSRQGGILKVSGLLDGAAADNINNYGTFDVYINGSLVKQNVTGCSEKWPKGTRYEIRNIRAADGKRFIGSSGASLAGELNTGTTAVILSFSTLVEPGPDWIEVNEIPPGLDTSICEIEYNNHYEATATVSPGSGWTQVAGSGVTTYVNAGSDYESDFALPESETRVLLGSYYYHYCGAGMGNRVNFAQTGQYTDYHRAGWSEAFYASGEYTDNDDPRYHSFTLVWNSGEWSGSAATCAAGRSAVWYKRFIYQDRTALTNYKWTMDSGWTAEKDSAAQSVTCRYRLKENKKLMLPLSTETIGEEAFAGTGAVEIVVPDGCKAIGSRAFADSPSLERITIPASVTAIAPDAFANCASLTIHAPAGSTVIALAIAQGIPYTIIG